MADKPVKATRWSWLRTLAAPLTIPAALLVIAITLAECCRELSVGAAEIDPPTAGSREDGRSSTSSAGPLNGNGMVHLQDIRNIPKRGSASALRQEQFSPSPRSGMTAEAGSAAPKALPMPALFAEPLSTQWRQASPAASSQFTKGPTMAQAHPLASLAALREKIQAPAVTPPSPAESALHARAADLEYLELRGQEAELAKFCGDAHPRLIAVRRRLAQLSEGRSLRAKAPMSNDGSEQSEPGQPVNPKVRSEGPPPLMVETVQQPPLMPPPPVQPLPTVQAQPMQPQFTPAPTGQPQVGVGHDNEVAILPQKGLKGPLKLPPPRPVVPIEVEPEPGRVPGLIQPDPLGAVPRPTPKQLKEQANYVDDFKDPTNTLDLIKGRSRLMVLKATPKRIQIADEAVASSALFGATELTFLGKTVGTTNLYLWFPSVEDKNKDVVLSYLIRVFPDPDEILRLKAMLKAWEIDINRTFHDSVIHLELVGDKVVVTGQAHDINDATQILKVLVSNSSGVAGLQGAQQGTPTPSNLTGKLVPADTVTNVPRAEQPNASKGATPGQENYLPSGSPNIINMMTIPGVQQVMLRVVVAEVNRTAARSIGLNFNLANSHASIQNLTGSLINSNSNGTTGTLLGAAGAGFSGVSPLTNIPIALSNGQVFLAINALKSMHYAKSLAEPNLVASNGHTATFLAGGEFPVPVVTGNTFGGLQGVNFVPYGVQLNFTPYITDKNRIRLNVSATVSTRDTTIGTNIGNSVVPGLNSRNFTSTIDMREGQTLAVAGLLQTNLGADRDQLPFLAEIPFINRFTGFDRTSAGEQELVILITPELVQPMKKGAPIPRLPGSDLFEPSDLEFYLHGRLEGLRMNDFRSPVMDDCQRIRQYNRCEQNYIFGPSGYVTPTNVQK